MSRWKLKGRRNNRKSKGRQARELAREQAQAQEQELAQAQAREPQPQPAGRSVVTGSLAGPDFSYTVDPMSAEDYPHLMRYFKAHEALPHFYRFDPARRKYQRHLADSLEQLADPEASLEALTRAIAILGHSPDPRAISALEAYSDAGRELSGMARMALQECLGMLAEERTAAYNLAGTN